MSVKKSFKLLAIAAMTLVFSILASTPSQADVWDWLAGRQSSLIPYYDPDAASTSTDGDTSAEDSVKTIVGNNLLDNVIPRPLRSITPQGLVPSQQTRTSYVTRWVRVPTTRYVPQWERNEKSGWTELRMKPCVTSTWQLRRIPVTSYRPIFPALLRPCDEATPLLNRIFNPLFAPGCGGCDIPQTPTPTAGGLKAKNTRPSVNPNKVQPDSEAEGSIEERRLGPGDGSAASGSEEADTEGSESEGSESEGAESEAAESEAAESEAAESEWILRGSRAAESEAAESTEEGEDAAEADKSEESADTAPADEPKPDSKEPSDDPGAAKKESSSVLKQPPIEPPTENKVPGQKDLEDDKDADGNTAVPYKLQPIPDTNRLPTVNPADAPQLIDSRDKTAFLPIVPARLTPVSLAPVSLPTRSSSVVRVTAVVPISKTVRRLDDSGWIRVGK